MCLVGEVLRQDVVAVGVELENAGVRTVMASELAKTSVGEAPRARRRRARRKRKRKRSKK